MQRFSDGCKILKQVSKREEKTKKKTRNNEEKKGRKKAEFSMQSQKYGKCK